MMKHNPPYYINSNNGTTISPRKESPRDPTPQTITPRDHPTGSTILATSTSGEFTRLNPDMEPVQFEAQFISNTF